MNQKMFLVFRRDGYNALDGNKNFLYRIDRRCNPFVMHIIEILMDLIVFFFKRFDYSFVFSIDIEGKGLFKMFRSAYWSLAIIDNSVDIVWLEFHHKKFSLLDIKECIKKFISEMKIMLKNREEENFLLNEEISALKLPFPQKKTDTENGDKPEPWEI